MEMFKGCYRIVHGSPAEHLDVCMHVLASFVKSSVVSYFRGILVGKYT